ncbi:GntR family transcriptional regulator [Sphingobium sp. Sx8-8]|uniref:GntR family transcriptional regulator n=1 Tax=Sphingobium sp. Sx8-8 TaxID=2933617 RepID=UPI001F58D488|nr:GntR family transcriptional regulator [Sphingobium sp. Sx8-8]
MASNRIRPPAAATKAKQNKPTGVPLADKAYQAILQGLFDRTIPAGAELSQAELMDMLGLTVQPLRDALLKLEAEGLVTIQARSCIRFVKADLELSRATYQFRSLIERAGARSLAETGATEEIDALIAGHLDLIAQIEAEGLGAEQEERVGALENQFHGALLGALRNPLIETTARRLKNYVTLLRLDRLVTAPLALRTLREHLDVLYACARRDADAAEAALTVHFQQALQRLLGMA